MKKDYYLDFPFAELKSQDGSFSLKIYSYDYAYPHAIHKFDRDWHKNHLILSMPAFKAEIDEVMFEGTLLEYFIEELVAFSALKKKEVNIKPTEPYFGLTFSVDKRKKVNVNGYVQYPVGWGAELQFEIETDLTYVDEFIRGLKSILKNFPSIS
ncbi:hypothetical protein KUV80_08480 [Fictibacillus nanhaiensis]|uniref:WapI family immunity protein n=1 Tax=Fictibacillus nanhaiensis TaxID=742169 RepID=UPI001C965B5B|nr:hypothetical protein [Fictibacillus nanhaiensis]MBY6036686.1 hypothetical protein [Fictibacillus nanhaiensis]